MKTHESQEMYLETILLLTKKKGRVRSVDIVEELDYAKSSVSRAVNLLLKDGFISMDKSGQITFTEKGREKADYIYERHHVITELLCSLGAEPDVAEDNACRIEHVISHELFEVIKKHLKNK